MRIRSDRSEIWGAAIKNTLKERCIKPHDEKHGHNELLLSILVYVTEFETYWVFLDWIRTYYKHKTIFRNKLFLGCFMRRTDSANSDGGTLVGRMNENECALYCLNQYPLCLAVDYKVSDQSCYTHTTTVGINWNSCCHRYEISCAGKFHYFFSTFYCLLIVSLYRSWILAFKSLHCLNIWSSY